MADVITKYQHATCTNVHKRGSLSSGDTFKALCGITATQDTSEAGRTLPKCAMCQAAFDIFAEGGPCTLCGKREH